MLTESQKKARNKWDSENMVTLACKVRREEAEAFRSHCVAERKTASAVLHEFIREYAGK